MNLYPLKQRFGNLLKGRKKLYTIPLMALALLILSVTLLTALVYAGLFGALPGKQTLKKIQNPVASEIYTADSVLMGKYYIQNRQDIDAEDITPLLHNALLATEDIRFYEHQGIDYKSLGRVFIKSILLMDQSAGGGSTITQQLVKNLYPRKNYGLLTMPVNKIKEMLVAKRLENMYTKKEIITLYLNTVPFGENTFGIKSAALRYFSTLPDSLNAQETALLVGMLKATNYYNPRANYEQAMQRRNIVLHQMTKYNYLDTTAKDSLQQLPIELDYEPLAHNAGIAPYFREYLRQELEEWCENHQNEKGNPYNLYTDGLKIYTTIDSRLQNHAARAVKEHMANLQAIFNKHWTNRDIWKDHPAIEKSLMKNIPKNEQSDSARTMEVFTWNGMEEKQMTSLDSLKHYLQFLQAGFLAMDVKSGEIRAWVGGINHQFFQYDHVTAKRQIGSTIKPLIYLSALENGTEPCDYFLNDSIIYKDFDNWNPRNANREYGGYYSLKGALVHSVNTISVQLLMETGIDKVINLANKAGIHSEMPAVPSLALGTADVSLLEMVQAYQALANHGQVKKHVYLRRIEDKHGKMLHEKKPDPSPTSIASEQNIETLTAMLREVVDSGTARSLRTTYRIQSDVAGKTGTTQNQTDGWFIGYTPSIVAGAWVGGDIQNIRFRDIDHGQGAVTAMPIWAKFVKHVYADKHYGHLKNESFDISEKTLDQMDCDDFKEETIKFKIIKKIKDMNLFKRLFRRNKD